MARCETPPKIMWQAVTRQGSSIIDDEDGLRAPPWQQNFDEAQLGCAMGANQSEAGRNKGLCTMGHRGSDVLSPR